MEESEPSAAEAKNDLATYGRAMRRGNHSVCGAIEKYWGLHGFTPEIVSAVLSCVATGLPLDAAIREATGYTE